MKTTAILNVGLARSPGQPLLNPITVRASLASHGFRVLCGRLSESGDEPTVIVLAIVPEDWSDALYLVACDLGQHAIAASFDGGATGWNVGPGARAWGAFNPDFFQSDVLGDSGERLRPGVRIEWDD